MFEGGTRISNLAELNFGAWHQESLGLKRIKHLPDEELSLTTDIDMTEASMEHPTAGRRRRHKSPPTLHAHIAIPVPRLEDHLDTEYGPSDEDGEKEAKRQRAEPTTPISTSSRLPYEYDRIMGITQVGSGETEKFEEGTDLVYHEAAENPNV